MGAEKDINRVRELIIGKDIARFEKKFDTIEAKQNRFQQDVLEHLETLTTKIDKMQHKQKKMTKKTHLQQDKTSMALKQIEQHVDNESKNTSEYLKTFKSELKMYTKAKLNGLDKNKISHDELATLFASLSDELKESDDITKHA